MGRLQAERMANERTSRDAERSWNGNLGQPKPHVQNVQGNQVNEDVNTIDDSNNR